VSDRTEHQMIIRPVSGWFDLHLGDLWRYRDLILLFVKRDFVSFYKQTILGPLWYLLQPLFSSTVFTIIFSSIAHIPTDGVPPFLFFLSGNVCWNYFANCLNGTSNTFVQNAGLFGKVYFPRLSVPIAVVMSNLIQFTIQFTVFLVAYAYFYFTAGELHVGFGILALPLLILQMAMLGLGVGILVSSLTTRYRDLTYLVGFGMQLWMYATPVVYPLSQVPEKYRSLYLLNPMAGIVEHFRGGFFGTAGPGWQADISGWAVTILIVFIGVLLFSRMQRNFMDTV